MKQYYEAFDSGSCHLRRLEDLAHPDVDHAWLWCLSHAHGRVLDNDEFAEAVRVRLGAGGPTDAGVCGACGQAVLDSGGSHASCCAVGEATRGHNAVRDLLYDFSLAADDATEKEPLGLIPSRPALRPADVLSPTVLSGRAAALDVGITSVEAASGGDAAEAMYQRKTSEREPFTDELAAQNVVYMPVVWTNFGRPHPGALTVIRAIARRVARRRGHASQKVVLRQFLRNLGVEIARRAARMSLACWPAAAEEPAGEVGRPPGL